MNEVMRIKTNGMDSAVRQIGDSWSLLIVWSALQGTTRFDNFQSRLGVARNILSNRLSKLVDEGILVKRPVHSGARRLDRSALLRFAGTVLPSCLFRARCLIQQAS